MLKRELNRTGIKQTDFSSFILNCKASNLSQLLNHPPHSKAPQSSKAMTRAIYNWLMDKNRVKNFRYAKKTAKRMGIEHVEFIYYSNSQCASQNDDDCILLSDDSEDNTFSMFSKKQIKKLAENFEINPYPELDTVIDLAENIGLSVDDVYRWYSQKHIFKEDYY